MEELKKYGDTGKVHWVECDLKDLKKTNEVAKQLTSEKQIDAVRAKPPKTSTPSKAKSKKQKASN